MFMMDFDMVDKLQLEDVPQIFFDLQIDGVNVPVLIEKTWRYARHNNDKAAIIVSLVILANAYFRAGDEEKSKLFETEYCKLMKKAEETLPETDVLEIKKFFLD